MRKRTAWPGHGGAERRRRSGRTRSEHVDGPGPRAVALDEEDRLPRPEVERSVDHRERLARTEEEHPEVRISIAVEPVVFPPRVGDQVSEKRLDVLQES